MVLIFKCFLVNDSARVALSTLSHTENDTRLKKLFQRDALVVDMRTVVGITGASGTVYGLRLLECLPGEKTVVVSDAAATVAGHETGMSRQDIEGLADESYGNDDMAAPIASGSAAFDAMVIAPCSTSTMSKIACGISDNLITRAAAVALKERRTLVLLIRETPLSAIILRNMQTLSEAGVVIMPASPAFYPRPSRVEEMVDFVVGRVLDQLGIENDLYLRWSGDEAPDEDQ